MDRLNIIARDHAVVLAGVIPLHQVFGRELGVVVQANDTGVQGSFLDPSGWMPTSEIVSPTGCPGHATAVGFYVGPMRCPPFLGH